MRPYTILFLIGVSLAVMTSPSVSGAQGRQRPNILFAIADDWAYGYAGAYGSKFVKTPAFDRVAREGVFSRAPTRPTRNALLARDHSHGS